VRAQSAKETGTVLWFDMRKRFGFISQDSGQKDVFIHLDQITKAGYQFLQKDQRVEYSVARAPSKGNGKGKIIAINIIVTAEAPPGSSDHPPPDEANQPTSRAESKRARNRERKNRGAQSRSGGGNGSGGGGSGGSGGGNGGSGGGNGGYRNFLDEPPQAQPQAQLQPQQPVILSKPRAEFVPAGEFVPGRPFIPAAVADAPEFTPMPVPQSEQTQSRRAFAKLPTPPTGAVTVTVRVATPADVDEAALVIYSSFRAAADAANTYNDTARSPARSKEIVRAAVHSDEIYAVVATVPADENDAEEGGEEYIVGFNCLHEANIPLFGMGPVGVRNGWQGSSIGSQLLQAALDRADAVCAAEGGGGGGGGDEGGGAGVMKPTVRLTVDAYNSTALALYVKAGFVVTEPLTVLENLPLPLTPSGIAAADELSLSSGGGKAADTAVLPEVGAEWDFCEDMESEDLQAVAALSEAYGGCDRSGEVRAAMAALPPRTSSDPINSADDDDENDDDAIGDGDADESQDDDDGNDSRKPLAQTGRGVCVVREVASGEVVAYTTGITFDGHTIAASVPAAIALLNGMRRSQPQAHLRMVLPFRSAAALGAWCLGEGGWRVVKQLLLMSRGVLRMPDGGSNAAAAAGGVFIPTADG
jgi:CspA family cold shock protein